MAWKFLNFMQFFRKFCNFVCWRPLPPGGWRLLLRGILDPPWLSCCQYTSACQRLKVTGNLTNRDFPNFECIKIRLESVLFLHLFPNLNGYRRSSVTLENFVPSHMNDDTNGLMKTKGHKREWPSVKNRGRCNKCRQVQVSMKTKMGTKGISKLKGYKMA